MKRLVYYKYLYIQIYKPVSFTCRYMRMRTNYKRGSVDSSGHLVSPGTFQGHSQPGNTRTQWPLLPVPRGWRTRTAGSWLSLNDINILIKHSIFYSSTPHYLKRASCLVGSMQFETLYTLNFYQPLKHSHTSTFLKSTDCSPYVEITIRHS